MVGAWHDQRRWGPYLLVRQIGSGGMGCVYEAQDTVLKHHVAVKVLHPHVAARPRAKERFLREGRAAASVRHPHVVQILGLGAEAGTPYLAMELLEPDSLATLIAREGALALEEALDIFIPVAAAMGAAHDAGVVHRDVKPSNVCFARLGGRLCPKVVDFSVSKVITEEGASEITATDGMIGTAAYMAPEQARSAGRASFLSDQYSLGVVLYQCVTGVLPYSGATVYEMLEAVMTAPLVAPGSRVTGIPAGFDDVVVRAMSRAPEDRFPSVRAFAAALLPFASERTRSAFVGELSAPDGHADPPAGTNEPSAPGSGEAPTVCETTGPVTTGDASNASRTRFEHTIWVGLAAMATLALVGRGVLVHAGRPPALGGSSRASVATEQARMQSTKAARFDEGASGPPSSSSEPAGAVIDPAPPTTILSKTISAPAPGRAKSAPREGPQPRRPQAPVAPAAASWTVGNNGAPVLPL